MTVTLGVRGRSRNGRKRFHEEGDPRAVFKEGKKKSREAERNSQEMEGRLVTNTA